MHTLKLMKISTKELSLVELSPFLLLSSCPPSFSLNSFARSFETLLGHLKVSGRVTYHGHDMNEFVPQRTASYISQDDVHFGEMTMRETLSYSARFQGVGYLYDMLAELTGREKAANIKPDPDINLFMKAAVSKGQTENVVTDYILELLGLEICADTVVGDDMVRGISGGQRKRVTTGN